MPAAPAAAPSLLTALLRAAGHQALNFDVSRFCVQELLRPANLSASLSRGTKPSVLPLTALQASLSHMQRHVDKLCDMATYGSLRDYEPPRLAVDEAFAVHASAHGASHWSPMSLLYEGDHDLDDPKALIRAVERGDEVFDPVLPAAARHVAAYKPGLVAFSVSSIDQLYGALRLAKLIRELLPPAHLCLGGPAVTRIRRGIRAFPPLFDLVDSVGLHEGEAQLLALAAALDAKDDLLTKVPDLLARRDGEVVSSAAVEPSCVALDELPVPELDDLVPGRWLTPAPRLPLSTTRNCYHNRCTFCAISRSFRAGFRHMTPERVLDHVRRLQERYPSAVIKEVSEAFPPATLLRYAALAASQEAPMPFETCLRFEPQFQSANAARALHRGGLRVAYFGLESGSAAQIQEMRKGIDLGIAADTLKSFAEEGIWCHVFFISGLPRETEKDHEESLEFISRYRPWIHSAQISSFSLAVDSDASALQARYGFKLRPRPEASFHVDHELEERGNIPSREETDRRVSELRTAAYQGADDTLARSRRVWDAHKIFFSLMAGGPEIPSRAPCARAIVKNGGAHD